MAAAGYVYLIEAAEQVAGLHKRLRTQSDVMRNPDGVVQDRGDVWAALWQLRDAELRLRAAAADHDPEAARAAAVRGG